MKTAIAYYSKHHGNMKKLLDAIVAADPSVVLIDVTVQPTADLSGYNRIASTPSDPPSPVVSYFHRKDCFSYAH